MFKINIKNLNPLSGMHSEELIGLDLSGSSLKIARGRLTSGRLEIIELLSRNISGVNEEEVSKIIRDYLGGVKAKKLKVINVVPSSLIITKNIEIPSINPQEIREIINLQAGRHTPFSREEIIVDYIEIGTYKRSYTKILLVIVARSAIKKQHLILEKAGFRPEKTLLGSEGIAWASPKILKIDSAIFPVNIIQLDEDSTDFTVVLKNKSIFIRSIPIGAVNLVSEKERYQERFIEEIRKSLEAYQNEDIERPPQAVILTGAVSDLNYLGEVLGESLHLPVRIVSYLGNLTISDKALNAAKGLRNTSFLSIISGMSAWREIKVDLIPEEIRLKKAIERRGRDLIKTGIFILIIFVLIFFILLSKIYFKNIYLSGLNSRYKSLLPEAQKIEGDFNKVNLIKEYLSKRGYSIEILTEIYDMIPLEIELSDIRFDSDGKFSIRGTADSMSVVYSFIDSMGKSKYFKDAKAKYTTKRKEGMKDVADFEITATLKKEPRR